ncbi:hypothetical protein [Intrasporangium mesophilum]
MPRSRRASGGALAVVPVALLVLAGCGSSSPGSASATQSASATPSTSTSTSAAGPAPAGAAWLDAGHGAAVVSMGSSTCVPQAGDITASGQTVTVAFTEPAATTPCTLDYVPRASYVALPSGVDVTKAVQIVGTGALAGSVTLSALSASPASAGQNTPSAGWVETSPAASDVPQGSFAFLTWGSSTCVPTVESVTSKSAGTLTVRFAAPATAACTMDMAPRVGLTVAPATVTGTDVRVSFVGASIAGTTTMLGAR